MHESELLTPKEAGKELGVNAKTIATWCRAGKLAHIRTPGGHRRILKSEIDRIKEMK